MVTPVSDIDKIFTRVLTVGPDIKGGGGISSVLRSYSHILPSFTFCPTNSRHGTAAGALALAALLVKLPFYRLRGFRILHAHGASGKSFFRKRIVMRWARLLGFKTIFHCHGGGFAEYAEKVGKGKIAAELNRCSAVVTLTHGWAKTFAGRIGIDGVHVINNVVEQPAVEITAHVHHTPVTGLFLGKLCRDKGIYDLIDTIAADKEYFDGRLRILVGGNGETDEFTRRVDEAGVGNIIEYLGWVGDDRKEQVFDAADFILLPSYIEGMPISILEGAIHYLPSIASAVGGVPELIDGTNGIMITPGDKDSLAAALKQYIEDPQLMLSHGASARAKIAPYLPNAVTASLRSLYHSII